MKNVLQGIVFIKKEKKKKKRKGKTGGK